MRLLLQHPQIATRDCAHCQKFQYDETKGTPIPSRRNEGEFELRYKNIPPPCRDKRGCLKGTPENPKTLTPQNIRAYMHYLECKAVDDWPRGEDGRVDPIVRRNAVIIKGELDAHEQSRQEQILLSLVQMPDKPR